MRIRLVVAADLDYDAHVALLKSAFNESAFSFEISKMFTCQFYQWKYSPPAGDAVIVQVHSDGGVAASISAMPLLLSGPEGNRRVWQIVDIATAPFARRRGYFRKSLEAIRSELPENEILVCFPNAKSAPELRRQAFGLVAELKTYARLVLPDVFARRIRSNERFTTRPLTFEHDFSVGTPSHLHLARTVDYFNWRYAHHPLHKYAKLIDGSPLDPTGLAVVRRFDVFGIGIAVLTELHGRTPNALGRVLRQVDAWCRLGGLRTLMTISASRPTINFLQIPRVVEPKRHIFVARYSGSSREPDRPMPGPWNIQIGDWDGL